jgi:hypothetical protein
MIFTPIPYEGDIISYDASTNDESSDDASEND